MSYADHYNRSSASGSLQHSRLAGYSSSAPYSAWGDSTRPKGGHSTALDDRRYTNNARAANGYQRSAGPNAAAGSASASGHSYHLPTSGNYGNHSFPSPATSATSSGSSLRTPPDLLLNGAALATSWKSVDKQKLHNNLTVTDIEKRLKLMANLPTEPISGELPTPPSSPRLQARDKTQDKARASGRASAGTKEAAATESGTTKKRKVSTRADDVGAQTKERRLSDSSDETFSRSKRDDQNQSRDKKAVAPRSLHRSLEIILPLDRRWDKDLFVSTAASFRARGRSLKHQGDQRLREESTMRIGSSPSSAACIATFEQMDAVLLYVYSFWCEDEAATIDTGTPGVIIAANWNTIFGLLKYVCDCQERNGFPALAGLCRLIEALVLRKVSDNENRLLQRRLAKLVASSAAIANTGSTYVAAGQSPSTPFGDTAAPSPASHHSAEVPPGDLSSAIADISSIMRKTVGESERSARLFAQARNALSPSTLQDSFPDVWQACLASSTVIEPVRDALRLNPEGFGSSSCVTDDAPSARWAWPLDHVTPLPHYVNFGRALLREAAARKNLKFQLAAITSHRS